MRDHIRGNSSAIVRDRELHVFTRRHLVHGMLIVEDVGHIRGDDGDGPAIGERIAGIHAEVEEHLLELAGIGLEAADLRLEISAHGDVLPDHTLQHLLHVAHSIVDVEDAQVKGLAAAEGEQLMRERRRKVRGLADFREMLVHPMLVLDLPDHQVAVAEDRGQDVVEIVRDPTGEPAHRIHLLRLQQFLLEALALGDIARNRDRPLMIPASLRIGESVSDTLIRRPSLRIRTVS